MEKLLISENRNIADAKIEQMNDVCARMNNIIMTYNNNEALEPIQAKETILTMSDNPKAWFDNQLLEQLGSGLNSSKRPNVEQLAKLYDVDYNSILDKLNLLSRLPLSKFDFDSDKLYFVSEDLKAQAIEEAKLYTQSDEEVRAFNLTRNLCRTLESYCNKMGITYNLHELKKTLGLELSGSGFNERPSFIQQQLRYPQIRENLK